MDLRITDKQCIANDIFAFDLESAQHGFDLGRHEPGAHILVTTPQGHQRSYSLCGHPADGKRWRIALKRDPLGRGGSLDMCDNLQPGDTLKANAPQNFFPLHTQAPKFIFIAGGIGITPIFSMVQALQASGHAPFKLYYCSKDPASTAFHGALTSDPLAVHVQMHHDHGDLSQALDLWPILETPTSAHIYVCGPAGLLESVMDMTGHWPAEQVHFESFKGTQVSAQSQDQSFKVRVNSSASLIEVAADQSLLQALRAHGLEVPSSCESGTCGACKTPYAAGTPIHRDHVLLEDEKTRFIMPCVSRGTADEILTLDL